MRVRTAAPNRFGPSASRAAIAAERELLQKDKRGLEISQGIFVAQVLAHPRTGFHLMHSMSQPTAEALSRLEEFRRDGSVDLIDQVLVKGLEWSITSTIPCHG